MAVFALIPLADNFTALTDQVVDRIHGSDRYQLASDAGWLVRYKGTSTEVSDHLQITGQPEGVKTPVGAVLVIPVTNYHGRASADMWEWLKDRLESDR